MTKLYAVPCLGTGKLSGQRIFHPAWLDKNIVNAKLVCWNKEFTNRTKAFQFARKHHSEYPNNKS